jgi:hypothetical protein
MVPDLGFLLPLDLPRSATHTTAALFTFCLPLGLAAYWLFQLLIKPAWCAVLPGRWRARLRAEHPVARIGNWRVWLGASVAVLIGAATHLVWDGFTHEDGRGVRMLPFLDDAGPNLQGQALPLFQWLQLASSVAGLVVLLVAVWAWSRGRDSVGRPAQPDPGTRPFPELGERERYAWRAAYLLPPIGWLAAAWVHGTPGIINALAGRLAVAGLVGAMVSLALVSALVRLRLGLLPRRLDDGATLQ